MRGSSCLQTALLHSVSLHVKELHFGQDQLRYKYAQRCPGGPVRYTTSQVLELQPLSPFNVSSTMARQVLTSRRVFPANQSSASATTTTLSILDATVTRFSPCAAIWLYDSANNTQLFDALEQSLSHTLTDYPHFAGQLRWARGPRPGRPQVTYGCQDDPGVELVRARYHGPLPAPKDDDDSAIWLAPEDFSQDNLLAEALLAFVDLARYEGLPGVSVQLTELDGGGWAVGVRMTHCLGDATVSRP